MAQSRTTQKDSTPVGGGGKKGKKAGGAQQVQGVNIWQHLADDDGNAKNAKEFDKIPHTEDEVFFKVNDELEGDELKQVAEDRVQLLNFIHQELFYTKIARTVPAPADNNVDNTEIYHQAEYNGRKIDVGVHFYQGSNGVYTARAFVKFVDADLSDDEYGLTIWADHAANGPEAKKDKGGKGVAGLSKFYWAPRWNYVIRYLRSRMEAYNRDGSQAIEIVEPSAPGVAEAAEDDNDPTEIEEPMEIPAGCTGIIIGPKGSKMQELKNQSGVVNIQMPERAEPKPKAREPVTMFLKGRKSAINKAKALIEAIVQEWKSAPRPDRNGGGGGSGGFQQTEGFAQQSEDFNQIQEGFGGDNGGSGDGAWGDSGNAGGDGGDGSWADSANAAAANGGGGGDNW
ncbi:hypothetical protein VTL71DRAFT_7588 [Oculimacula yallundae]|uniref:K Homology domain-containing protein n=1 Tax=Oculimacula yallundae TaxID=86028 RepID=A0ABR4BUJ2_9HELO